MKMIRYGTQGLGHRSVTEDERGQKKPNDVIPLPGRGIVGGNWSARSKTTVRSKGFSP